MDGWNTILSYWGPAYFQGRTASLREGKIFPGCHFFRFFDLQHLRSGLGTSKRDIRAKLVRTRGFGS